MWEEMLQRQEEEYQQVKQHDTHRHIAYNQMQPERYQNINEQNSKIIHHLVCRFTWYANHSVASLVSRMIGFHCDIFQCPLDLKQTRRSSMLKCMECRHSPHRLSITVVPSHDLHPKEAWRDLSNSNNQPQTREPFLTHKMVGQTHL